MPELDTCFSNPRDRTKLVKTDFIYLLVLDLGCYSRSSLRGEEPSFSQRELFRQTGMWIPKVHNRPSQLFAAPITDLFSDREMVDGAWRLQWYGEGCWLIHYSHAQYDGILVAETRGLWRACALDVLCLRAVFVFRFFGCFENIITIDRDYMPELCMSSIYFDVKDRQIAVYFALSLGTWPDKPFEHDNWGDTMGNENLFSIMVRVLFPFTTWH